MSPHLFVYGTLMSGGENHRLLARRAELIGPGRMLGRLFLVDYFPGSWILTTPSRSWSGRSGAWSSRTFSGSSTISRDARRLLLSLSVPRGR